MAETHNSNVKWDVLIIWKLSPIIYKLHIPLTIFEILQFLDFSQFWALWLLET